VEPVERSDSVGRTIPLWAQIADALVVALLALVVYIVLFGGFRVVLFGIRISVGSPVRLIGQALIIALPRHLFCRRPTLVGRLSHLSRLITRPIALAGGWLVRLPSDVWMMTTLSLATRAVVLFIGFVAVVGIGYPEGAPQWRASDNELWNLPARWDSGWYLGIAQHGYEWNAGLHGQQNIVFFPAYPLLTRGLSWVLWRGLDDPGRVLWAGVIVSVVAFTFGLIYLYKLAARIAGDEMATVATSLLAAYPFALFFSGAYTEGLFLLAVCGTFYHFSRGEYWRAAALGVLTGLVRPNGWMASASLAMMALPFIGWLKLPAPLHRLLAGTTGASCPRSASRARPAAMVAAIVAPGIGLLTYCFYIYRLTGDPFMWGKLLTYWDRDFNGLAMLQSDLDKLTSSGLVGYVARQPLDAMNAMGLLFGLATIWPVTRRLGLAYGFYVLVNLALPATSGGLVSIGRYSSVLFPSFIWLALAAPQRARPAIFSVFALSQGLAAALFFTWRPVY
jgi:hypothetical protein